MAGLVISAQVMCSFLQVYQEKVYDLLNPRLMVDLPVREHPKKGTHAFLTRTKFCQLSSDRQMLGFYSKIELKSGG